MYQFKHDVKQINQFIHTVFVEQLKLENVAEMDEQKYDTSLMDVPRFVCRSLPYKPEHLDKLIEYVEKLFTPLADEQKEAPSLDQASNPALRLFLTMMQFDKRLAKTITEKGVVPLVSPERLEKITPLLLKIRDAALKREDMITAALAQVQMNADPSVPRNKSLELSIKEMALKKWQAKAGLNPEEMAILQKNFDAFDLYNLTAFAQGEVTEEGAYTLLVNIVNGNNEALAKKLFDSFQMTERQQYYLFRYMMKTSDKNIFDKLAKFIVPESGVIQAKMLIYLTEVTEKLETSMPDMPVKMTELNGILKNLIKNKININAKNERGNTMLHFAALFYASHIADEILFEIKEIDIEAKNAKGQTPLLVAVDRYLTSRKPEDYYPFVSTLRRLLEHGADINAVDNNGKTALMLAKEKGDEDLVKILLEHSTGVWCRFRKSGAPPVEVKADFKADLKITSQDIDELVKLLQKGPEPFDEKQFHAENEVDLEKKFEILHEQCKKQLKKMLNDLYSTLKESTDENLKVRSDYLKYLLLFIKRTSENDLHWLEKHLTMAINLNDCKLVNLLLAIGVDVNARDNYGNPAIFVALETNNISPDIIQALINYKFDLAATHSRSQLTGHTALMTACLASSSGTEHILRQETILQMLIQYCIDQRVSLAAKTPKGETALMFCARNFKPFAMRALINAARRNRIDIGISQADQMQKTVLHVIFHENREEKDDKALSLSWYTELLLKTDPKFKIDSQDSDGETPLMKALRQRCYVSAKVILNHGADPGIKNAEGQFVVFKLVTPQSNPRMHALLINAYQARKAEKEAALGDKRAKAIASRESKTPAAVTDLFNPEKFAARAASESASDVEAQKKRKDLSG